MSFVLAIEPDSTQADPLRSVVSAHAGAELVIVASASAAIVTMNQRLPDLVLIGGAISPQQRAGITAHIASLKRVPAIPTIEIPPLAHPALVQSSDDASPDPANMATAATHHDLFAQQIEACLTIEERDGFEGELALDLPEIDENAIAGIADVASEMFSADTSRLDAPAEGRSEAGDEVIEARAPEGRDLSDSPSDYTRDSLAAQVEEARREAEFAVAREAARVKAESDMLRAAAIEEARLAAEAEATRRALEAEVARVRAQTDLQVQTAVEHARRETEARFEEQVARATAETAARLEAQVASARGEAEQVRHAHRQATLEAERIRTEAAESARTAAEAALATETERIRTEAQQRLDTEIAALHADAERRRTTELDQIRAASQMAQPSRGSVLSSVPRLRWDLVAAAAVLVAAVSAGAFWLPRVLSSAARTSSALAGSAGRAASEAASKVAKVAASAAPSVASAPDDADRTDASTTAVIGADAGPEQAAQSSAALPGFLAAFSRIPMDLYADGRRIGTTEDGQLLLPAGTHKIEFVSQRFRYRSTISVRIRPGQVTPHTLAMPPGRLRVSTTPGAEIWMEGARIGVAPIEAIDVPIGTHEVLVRDPSGSERRQAVEIRYGEISEVTIVPAAGNANVQSPPRLAPLSQYKSR